MDTPYIPIDGQTVSIDEAKSFDVFRKSGDRMVPFQPDGVPSRSDSSGTDGGTDTNTLYIRKKDISNYYTYLEGVLGTILKHPEIEGTVKARTAFNTMVAIGKSLFTTPERNLLKRYKQAVIETVQFIMTDEHALRLLINQTDYRFSLHNHNINVGIFSTGLTKKVLGGDTTHNFDEIGAGFFLHDIGKTSIPVEILYKKGPLSNVEWRLIKRHPQEGLRILNEFELLTSEVNLVVAQHHERHNGRGYPKGLRGDSIHVYGKICSIADCFDGLTSQRPYRAKHTTFNALKIMKHEMFRDFDPEFFQKFVMLLSS